MNRVLFSSVSEHWATPESLYRLLDAEFHFTLDPCPLNDAEWKDGTYRSWVGHRVFCNPPYGSGITKWLMKAGEADVAVFLLPSRTDTLWWHEYAMKANEIRFCRGRLKFGSSANSAPFPSCLVIFKR